MSDLSVPQCSVEISSNDLWQRSVFGNWGGGGGGGSAGERT